MSTHIHHLHALAETSTSLARSNLEKLAHRSSGGAKAKARAARNLLVQTVVCNALGALALQRLDRAIIDRAALDAVLVSALTTRRDGAPVQDPDARALLSTIGAAEVVDQASKQLKYFGYGLQLRGQDVFVVPTQNG